MFKIETFNLAELISWAFLAYFIAINLFYFFLNFSSLFTIHRYVQWRDLQDLPQSYTDFEIPISIIAPAYNEEKNIVASIYSLLQLDYPQYEIIVVNDGSKDKTLEVLIKEFSLIPFAEASQEHCKTEKIKSVYRSQNYPNLRIIDKENGGKADALNAGINSSRYPLFCSIDSDSILQRNSLRKVVQPFLEDPNTIASGGTVRVANGCLIEKGFMMEVKLPKKFLPLVQIVEYLRAFLFGRMGWAGLNGVLIISGAFGLFHKQSVIDAGCYKKHTIGEDMELVVRLHRMKRLQQKPYRIAFVPDPICWTEAPEDLKTLKQQRVRWQRGLCESLWSNRKLLFNPKGGVVSWMSFPFMIFFEALEPLVQLSGYLVTLIFYLTGQISLDFFVAFVILVLSMGSLLSVSSLFLEEISFHVYPGMRQSIILFFSSILENFGYRQLNAYWRLLGLLEWFFGYKKKWGTMVRKGMN
ncbi:MAG: glycosyltransferase family 2 protein [Deltaproteobacteria bacterium]|nr:glycosyltransferase family 2 protein [Deltaproteobacteria bacterium]